jgi:hypothetical protein
VEQLFSGQMVREMGRNSTTTLRQDREQTDKQKMGNGNPTQISNDTVGPMGILKWHSTRPDGPLAVAKHTFLNSLIGEDFTRGTDGIDKHYYYLFEGDNTLDNLQAAYIITEQQWLQTLLSARQDYEPPEAAIAKES